MNNFIWDLYKRSGGDKIIERFHNNLTEGISDEYISTIKEMMGCFQVCESIIDEASVQLRDLKSDTDQNPPNSSLRVSDFYDNGEELIDSAFNEAYSEWKKQADNDDKNVFSFFIRNLDFLSTALTLDYPGLFIPYHYFCTYNVLELIADTFGIQLPIIPIKSDFRARTWHYAEICKALYLFREKHGLSVYELCAFLYDFAPKYVGGVDSYILKDLPNPKSAYFVGGGGDNSDKDAEDNPENISFWQCSPGTRAGDMIVMYLRTPISSISSIWRSCSVGFIDPFFWYYRCTYIGYPVKGKRIPIAKIKKDKTLSQMPIVQKNMQGINGVELKPSEYNYIVDKLKANVPKLEYILDSDTGACVNEKEVEERLIKPLLKKLGYGEEDYKQQFYVEIGNHNYALIPDFVLLPSAANGHYSGFATVEAKRSITSPSFMEETKKQARSYAKMVGAKYSAIASQEGLWITESKDDYTEEIFAEIWEGLKNEDIFYSLSRLIGNKK